MQPRDERGARAWVGVIALGTVALLLALSGRYGYHRDELYFIEAGKRLAWGYVDQPPLTPFFARLTDPFGYALPVLRLLPALSIGAIVVFAAAFARRFEGGSFAQVLAALTVATGAIFLTIGHLLSTTTFDVLIWVVLLYLVVRITQTNDHRLWLLVGLVAGIGLLNKWTVLYVIGGLGVGLGLTEQRRAFRSAFLWAGAAVALAMWLPNLLWQASHDWPFFDMAGSLYAEGVEDANSFLFVPAQILFIGPVALPVWIVGLRAFFRDAAMRRYRFVGWAFLVLAFVFVAVSAKPYFLAPLYVPVLGAGAVVVERWLPRRRRLTRGRILAAVGLGGLAVLPLALPVLPATTLAGTPITEINPELAETHGWVAFVEQVASAYEAAVPADRRSEAVVFTASYGEAGAIDLYGPRMGLPPASSGHNTYWLWGPPDGEPVLIVGSFPPGYLDERFVGVRRVGTIENPAGLENEEHLAPIWLAERPRESWNRIWPTLRHFN